MIPLGTRSRTIVPGLVALVATVTLGAPEALFCDPLAELDAARRARADMAALARAPAIPVPPVAIADESVVAPDGAVAATAVQDTVRRVAAQTGVLIERLDIAGEPEPESPLRLHLLASGNEKAVLRFAAELQATTPLLALPRWDLSSSKGTAGALRLDADILSAWQEAR